MAWKLKRLKYRLRIDGFRFTFRCVITDLLGLKKKRKLIDAARNTLRFQHDYVAENEERNSYFYLGDGDGKSGEGLIGDR